MIEYNGYYIKKHKLFPNMYFLSTEGVGGRIPNILGGTFTSPDLAREGIDAYLRIRETLKERKDASKAKSKSGD